MLDFAAEHAVAWRLALDLATEMIMTPPLDRYAGRLVKEAREDFGAIVASVDLNMTPAKYMRLYKAFHEVVTPDASGRQAFAAARRRPSRPTGRFARNSSRGARCGDGDPSTRMCRCFQRSGSIAAIRSLPGMVSNGWLSAKSSNKSLNRDRQEP